MTPMQTIAAQAVIVASHARVIADDDTSEQVRRLGEALELAMAAVGALTRLLESERGAAVPQQHPSLLAVTGDAEVVDLRSRPAWLVPLTSDEESSS